MTNRNATYSSIMATAMLTLGLALAPAAQASPPSSGNTLVDVAIAVNGPGSPYEGAFDTLIAAVLAAKPGVLERLTGNGQSTVFAPTDDAFSALGLSAENVGTLPQDFLTDVLLYHVVAGNRDAATVLGSTRLRTLQGGILRQSGGVLTDTLGRMATIIVTDVPASNGVIHAIDTVVLPYAP